MQTTEVVQRSVRSIRAQFEEPSLVPTLTRLLAEGEPVAVERLAAAGDWSLEQVRAELAKHPAVEWDELSGIAGFGLTLRPTPHKLSFDDRTVFGWCATDVLVFPVILGRPGVTESTCPVTGRLIRAEVTPDAVVSAEPPEAVVSEVRPTERVADVRAEICGLGHFFASPEAASGWLAQHPDGIVHPVADDFEIHRHAMAELGWVQP